MTEPLLKISEVTTQVKLSRATIYRRMGKGTFPKARDYDGAKRWRTEVVEAFKARGRDWRAALPPDFDP